MNKLMVVFGVMLLGACSADVDLEFEPVLETEVVQASVTLVLPEKGAFQSVGAVTAVCPEGFEPVTGHCSLGTKGAYVKEMGLDGTDEIPIVERQAEVTATGFVCGGRLTADGWVRLTAYVECEGVVGQ